MRTTNSLTNRIVALALSIIMVLGMIPTGVMAVEDAQTYGVLEGLTNGVTIESKTGAEVKAVYTGTLNWIAKDESVGRNADGWWVGVKITAPETIKLDKAQYTNGSGTLMFKDYNDSADDAAVQYMGLWGLVKEDYLRSANQTDGLSTYTWTFDWDGDGIFEQKVVLDVDAARTVLLNESGVQVYPAASVGNGTMESLTAGATLSEDAGNTNITYANMSLGWFPKDLTVGRGQDGWWIGAKITAPAALTTETDFDNVTYQRFEGNKWSDAKSFWNAQDSDKNIADTTRYLTVWGLITPDLINKDTDKILTYQYRFDWNKDGIYEQTLVLKVDAASVKLMKDGIQQFPLQFGAVEALTAGQVTGSETGDSVITVEDITLNWSPKDPSVGRGQDGWWVGAKITAPANMTTFETCGNIKYQRFESGKWSDPKDFWAAQDSNKDVTDTARYLTMWGLITPELIARDDNGILSYQYRFDWNQDGEYEQMLTMNVDASKLILLDENGVQIYPTLGVVTPLTNGVVTGNTTGNTTVEIGKVTLPWSPADETVGRGQAGWWTGIKVTAPSGADLENAKFRRKLTADTWTEAMAFAPDDGTQDTMQLWGLVTAEYLDMFIGYGRNMNYTWQFDWNNDGTFEQTITMSVDPANIKLKQADFGFNIDEETITYGDNDNKYTIKVPTGGQAKELSYSVSDPEVATVNADGTLTIHKAGEITITATLSGEHYVDITASYKLIINKAEQKDFGFDNPDTTITWQEEELEAYALKNAIGTVTWSIAGESDVATIDAATGKIKLLKAGTFTLQVQNTGDECYKESGIKEITIVVELKAQTGFGFAKDSDTVTYNDPDKNGAGEANRYTLLTSGGQVENGAVIYSIVEGSDYAKLVNGVLEIEKAGTVVVEAYREGNACYADSEPVQFTLTINKAKQSFTFRDGESVSKLYGIKNYENPVQWPELHGTGTVTYSVVSKDDIGAELDSATGILTFGDSEGKVGSITIKAFKAEDDCYEKAEATYTLTVSYLDKPQEDCVLSGDKATEESTSDWFVKNLFINAPAGYKISFDNELSTADWGEKQPYAEPGETTAKVYLQRIADGAITDAIDVPVKYDATAATNLKIEYKSSFLQVFLQKTFLLTKSEMTVEFSAEDADSGIAKVEYSLDAGQTFTSLEAKDGVYSIVIQEEMKNQLALRVTNGADIISEVKVDEKVLVIDKSKPEIAVVKFADQCIWHNDILYTWNDEFTVTFSVTDENFADIMNQEKDGTQKSLPVVTVNGEVQTLDWGNGAYGEAVLPLPNEGDYKIVVTANDRLNEADAYEVEVHVDRTPPVINKVKFDAGEVLDTKDGRDYYNAYQTATLVIEEHNFYPDYVNVIITADGKQVSALDYVKENWVSDGDKHTIVFEFKEDANYTLDVECLDIAGNAAADYTEELFTVDTTEPGENAITIEYNTLWWPTFLNEVFGFAKDSVEVTIKANDATAGIKSLSYSTDGEHFTLVEKDTHQFTIPAQYKGEIIVRATDYSGWTTEYVDGKTVIVDNIRPEFQISYDTVNRKDQILADNNGVVSDRQTMETSTEQTRFVYNGNVTATLQVEEEHFYESQFKIIVTRDGKTLEEKDQITVDGYYGSAWTEKEQDGKKYQVKTLTLSGDGDYVITVEYSDESKNGMNWSTGEHTGKGETKYVSNIHTIDTTAPKVTVSYTDKDTEVANTRYYSDDRTATITIEDRNFRPNEVVFTVEAVDVADKDVPIFDYESLKLTSWLNNGEVWRLVGSNTWQTNVDIPFSIDGNYTVNVAYKDIAQNVAVVNPYETTFTVDHKEPNDLSISYSKNVFETIVSAISFGYYKAPVTVTMTATDLTAGVEYFTISAKKEGPATTTTVEIPQNLVVDSNGKFVGGSAGFLKEGDVKVTVENGTVTMTFDAPAQFRGLFEFSATDMAHLSSNQDHKQVLVVDSIAPTRTVTYKPTTIVDKATLKNVNAVNEGDNVILYYNTDAVAYIEIVEANFYPEDVVVKVNGAAVNLDSQWTTPQDRTDDVWTNTLTLKGDGDYVITMEYTDRSTNEMKVYTSQTIVIDTTAPVIDVKYANTDVKNTIDGRDYFSATQTATVTIKEHNFRADEVVVKVTAKDVLNKDVLTLNADGTVKAYAEQGADRSNWTAYEAGTWRVKDDTFVLTLTYNADANYTFDIEYQDIATNKAADYTQDLFTVDKTAPVNLEVKYSTSVFEQIKESITFGYYNAQMTVTIKAEDDTSGIYHFAYSYIKGKGVSGVNAELLDQAIKEAEITYDGKKATATFTIPKMVLGSDNQFNGTVQFTAFDRSEVSTERKDSTVIVVDNITPTSKITYNAPVQEANGISYYNGNIDATIVITEANFDSLDTVVSVTKDGVSYPVKVTWVDNNVDTHTGTFTLTEDGDYFVSVEYKDKSGNQMASYKSNELTLDTTLPTIKVSNIKANTANKDDVYSFVITVNDTNLDATSIKPVLKAVKKTAEGIYNVVDIDLGNATTVVNGQTYTYTVENLPDDGLYTLTCQVKDMSANGMSQIVLDDSKAYDQVQFSINRNGSAFGYGNTFTEELVGQYFIYSVAEDVVIVEVNVDPIEEYKVTLNGKELVAGTDYTTVQTSNNGEWSKRTYTINKSLFEAEGEYSVIVSSVDKADTTAFSDIKNLSLSFVVDQTKPVLTITGLEAGGRYQTDAQTVTLIPTDEGGRLNALTVLALDSNGNPLKDKNGVDISVRFQMSGEELLKFLEEKDGVITFEVPEGLNNQIRIICNDCAINAQNLTNEYNELFERVTVSRNKFVIFYANTPLFVGTIVGVVVAIGAIIFLIKRKSNKKKATAKA